MSKPESLSKSAQSVQEALVKRGLPLKVVELSASTRTAQEAAEAIGCTVGQIAKSLIFRTVTTKRPILVIASGINRVNEKALEQHIGEKIEKADADFIRDVTGFAIGGIPPVGHRQTIDTFIDSDLLTYKEIWAAAGTPHAVFCLESIQLAPLTAGKVISIKA